jgi:pimeloyl-ACP methyl ester carboxylesterase
MRQRGRQDAPNPVPSWRLEIRREDRPNPGRGVPAGRKDRLAKPPIFGSLSAMPRFSRWLNLFLAAAALAFLPRAARAQDLPPMKAVAVFGQRIAYYDLGSGPVVVLLHGAGTSARRDWGTCLRALAAHHRVLAPDQLGWGASDKPLIDYGIQTWVDTLGEFLRIQQVKDFDLAGESLGGWIAARYTVQALAGDAVSPAFALPRPRRLVLTDAAGHRHVVAHNGESDPGSVTSLAGTKGLLGAIFVDPARSSDASVREWFGMALGKGDAWTLRALFTNRAIIAEAVDDQLPAITIPTLVVWGAGDHIVSLDDGKDFAARIPGARLVVIPGAGHAPEIEQPALYLAAVLPFLNSP